jgi:hypothetical protein
VTTNGAVEAGVLAEFVGEAPDAGVVDVLALLGVLLGIDGGVEVSKMMDVNEAAAIAAVVGVASVEPRRTLALCLVDAEADNSAEPMRVL